VKTGDEFGAGTDANVYIVLIGDKGKSGKLPLKSSEAGGNKFERAQTDVFYLEMSDLGKLKKLLLGYDGSGNSLTYL